MSTEHKDIKLVEALEGLKTELEGKTSKEVKEAFTEFEKEFSEKANTNTKSILDAGLEGVKQELLEKQKEMQKHMDKLDIKLNKTQPVNGAIASKANYQNQISKGIKDNFQTHVLPANKTKFNIKETALMDTKVVGDMTVANNLTGNSVITYQPGVAMLPNQKINLSQLVPTVTSATGTYVIYRETGSEGGIGEVTVPGDPKPQIDYDFTEVTYQANFIAGFARYSREMAQDLPYLESFLPQAMRRDYFIAENGLFEAALAAEATPSTEVITGQTQIEMLINDGANLEEATGDAGYDVTGYVIRPLDWARIAATNPNDFSLPGIVNIVNGQLTINGVPVFKATWLQPNEYYVGDWAMAKQVIVQGAGLNLQFFEQDADNVTENKVTARIEQRTVLAIDRPDAFILGDFTAV